ncbi:MAG: phospho-sugar mutase [Bifidobacteriaceae bacterium]|jgi:phosphomannomutase|nr:phospho-sugar mutase [Bifidobacteriaceae bacterium]
MSNVSARLKAEAEAWISADPDPQTRGELAALLAAAEAGDQGAAAELADAFSGPLAFGTAGLRGKLGPGPARMNRAVVIRAAAGLMAYLQGVIGQGEGEPTPAAAPTSRFQNTAELAVRRLAETELGARLGLQRRIRRPGTAAPKVVIGYDARHGSATFALDTAAVVVAAGGRALLWERTCPTPLLAHAVRRLSADAGVMVTASHNPAQDNGYKVYLGARAAAGPGQGVQIVPPADQDIAALIAAAPPADQVKRAARGWQAVGGDLEREYLRQAVAGVSPAPGAGDLRIVHTAMHGVGGRIALPAFAAAGFSDVHPVPEQAQPDPDFPTVAFPNPEEPGAIDLARALAEQIGADLVIAHDPDADRCAVAVFDPHGPRGGSWRALTGDEVGALLGEEAAKVWREVPETSDAARPALASSVVSSRLLARIARDHLLRYERTLTGFKWIARTPGLVFGYEEAIGYCVRPDLVRDKDGITAGLAVARLAARAKLAHRTLIDLLDDLARKHGLHLGGQVALRFADASGPGGVMRRLRRAAPQRIGDAAVARMIDLASGWEGLAPTDALIFSLEDASRLVVRPSGTEPKLKCYLEVVAPVPATADSLGLTAIRRQAAARLDRLSQAAKDLLAADNR